MYKRLLEIREYLHACPEVGFEEFKTSSYLAGELKKAGFAVKTGIGGTGVIGVLEGKAKGQVIGLRADMDALKQELEGETINIHSCGHDVNCAIMLGVAEYFGQKGLEKGTVQVLFQPAEEVIEGAKRMIADGAGEGLDYLIATHLRPITEARFEQATPALRTCSTAVVKIKIKGKPAHGSRPHLGINAIDSATTVIQSINAIRINSNVPHSAKITQIKGGTPSYNIIPEHAEMTFDVRARNNETMAELLSQIERVAIAGAGVLGAEGSFAVEHAALAAIYNDEIIAIAKEAIIEVLGPTGVLPEIYTEGGEDFHYFAHAYPAIKATTIGLGADVTPGMHDPKMTYNLGVMEHGFKIVKAVVERILNKGNNVSAE